LAGAGGQFADSRNARHLTSVPRFQLQLTKAIKLKVP
jgi:uncharacterized 2Fe-2S/4Fe-4S cluster protein (DUF4445 family)